MGKFTRDIKIEALAALAGGVSRAEVCKKYGVANDELHYWEEEHDRGELDGGFSQDNAHTDEQQDELFRELGKALFRIAKLEREMSKKRRRRRRSRGGGSPSTASEASSKAKGGK